LAIDDVVEMTVARGRKGYKKAHKMKDHYIVCGAGRVGQEVAKILSESGESFLVMDSDSRVTDDLKDHGIPCVLVDGTDEEGLKEAGIERAKSLACMLSDDATNVFTCLVAKELNPDIYIVARAATDSAVPKMLKARANKVFNPYSTTAVRVSHTLRKPTVVDYLEIASTQTKFDLQIEEIFIPPESSLTGVQIANSQLRERENVITTAIQKEGNRMIYNPPATEVIEGGNVLIALGSQESLEALRKRIAS